LEQKIKYLTKEETVTSFEQEEEKKRKRIKVSL
jgi:hypothetical protein